MDSAKRLSFINCQSNNVQLRWTVQRVPCQTLRGKVKFAACHLIDGVFDAIYSSMTNKIGSMSPAADELHNFINFSMYFRVVDAFIAGLDATNQICSIKRRWPIRVPSVGASASIHIHLFECRRYVYAYCCCFFSLHLVKSGVYYEVKWYSNEICCFFQNEIALIALPNVMPRLRIFLSSKMMCKFWQVLRHSS